MNWEYSCGAVIYSTLDGLRRYCVIQSLGGDYGFPKGHMEPGETEQDTALREVWEEVGLRPRILDGFREVNTYPLPNRPGVWKQVTIYLAECGTPELQYQPEELTGAWMMTYEEAMEKLTFPESKRILTAAERFLEERDASAYQTGIQRINLPTDHAVG